MKYWNYFIQIVHLNNTQIIIIKGLKNLGNSSENNALDAWHNCIAIAKTEATSTNYR